MEPNEAPVGRNTLYEQVWTDPVKVSAQRYGLSDVGLAKICKKLPIPIPSRGYWAKVKAGRVMNKVPLPPLRASVRWFDIVRQPRNRLSTCERLLFGTDGRRMRYWGN